METYTKNISMHIGYYKMSYHLTYYRFFFHRQHWHIILIPKHLTGKNSLVFEISDY
jgi:hypothetical protein